MDTDKYKIEDGMSANVPYSPEELEDAKALMDIDLHNKAYDKLNDIGAAIAQRDAAVFCDENNVITEETDDDAEVVIMLDDITNPSDDSDIEIEISED